MKSNRILLPLDIAHCPLEAFTTVNELAQGPASTVILLHIVHLNIVAPVNSLYREISQEAHWHLSQLAKRYLNPSLHVHTCVRQGTPCDEFWQSLNASALL